MPVHLRVLLFDMDNTLFDLVGAQIAACDCVVRHLGHDDGDELFSCFLTGSHGFESTENIRQYMQERRIPTNGMYEEACRIYATEKLRHITPYPGLQRPCGRSGKWGFPTGIVTDAEKADATLRLDKCGLSPFFDCMITFDMVRVKKPAPDPFLTALGTISARRSIPFLSATVPGGISNPVKNWGSEPCMPGTGRFSKTRDYTGADFVIDRMDEILRYSKRLTGFAFLTGFFRIRNPGKNTRADAGLPEIMRQNGFFVRNPDQILKKPQVP